MPRTGPSPWDCKTCGHPIPWELIPGGRGRPRIYCCDDCRNVAARLEQLHELVRLGKALTPEAAEALRAKLDRVQLAIRVS